MDEKLRKLVWRLGQNHVQREGLEQTGLKRREEEEEELNRLNAAGVLVDREEDMPGLGTGGDDRRRPRL